MNISLCGVLCEKIYTEIGLDPVIVDDLAFQIVTVDGVHYCVFRGTNNFKNGWRDILARPVRSSRGHLAHRGFVGAFDELADSVRKALPVGAKKIVFTGHSLGGAIAVLMAEAFNYPAVTFGCPRVYLRWGKVPTIDHTRIICDDDPVPMIPYFTYKHLNKADITLTDDDGGIDVADHSISVYNKRLEKYK